MCGRKVTYQGYGPLQSRTKILNSVILAHTKNNAVAIQEQRKKTGRNRKKRWKKLLEKSFA
jgi:hypothetical protein